MIHNMDILWRAWNIVGVLWFLLLFRFTLIKLIREPPKFTPLEALFMSFAIVIAYHSILDLAGLSIWIPLNLKYGVRVLEKILHEDVYHIFLIGSGGAAYFMVKNRIQLSKIFKIWMILFFVLMIPVCIRLNYLDYRLFSEPWKTYLFWAIYVPNYLGWGIAYVSLWKKQGKDEH